jgi:hypothetical protein
MVDYVYPAAMEAVACDAHINDLPTLDMSRYRTVVLQCVRPSQQQRSTHRRRPTLVVPCTGNFDDLLDPTRISELTGI